EDRPDIRERVPAVLVPSAGDRVRVEHHEEEDGRALARIRSGSEPAALRGKRPADPRGKQLVDEAESVALVLAERKEGGGPGGIRGLASLPIHRPAASQRTSLARELLHAPHGDGGRGEIDE